MENAIFGLVLFCIYLCSVSCFFKSSKVRSNTSEVELNKPTEKQIQEMFQAIDEDSTPVDDENTDQQQMIEQLTIQFNENQDIIQELLDNDSAKKLPDQATTEVPAISEIIDQESANQRLDDLLLMLEEGNKQAEEFLSDEYSEKVIKEMIEQPLADALNIEKLTLRQARPVAKALDIRQKIKGKHVPIKKLRAQIKERLQGEPGLLPTVYKILDIPFPFNRRNLAPMFFKGGY